MADESPIDLVLASQSPRRRELLSERGYGFRIVKPDPTAEDQQQPGEAPAEFVARLAYQKAMDVAKRVTDSVVIGCDTVAVLGDRILGKPVDRKDARRMLELLSGTEHLVISGLCLVETRNLGRHLESPLVRTATTRLKMDRLTESMLSEYLDSGSWQGKAGAFGYQDKNDWLHIVEGSESNVVGLPLELLEEMLESVRPDLVPHEGKSQG